MEYKFNKHEDILVCDKEVVNILPFFKEFDTYVSIQLNDFLKYDSSYTIWGGVASNLLLQILKLSDIFYSVHDIEFFLVKKNKIIYDQALYSLLDKNSLGNQFLPIGGFSIIKKLNGSNANNFQKNRIAMKDGDLYMNTITMDVYDKTVIFKAPLNQIKHLVNGNMELLIKDFDGLITVNRLFRRIYRTIPKIIRFEKVCDMFISEETEKKIGALIDRYFISSIKSNKYNNILETIYLKTLSETLKRLSIFNETRMENIETYKEFYLESKMDITNHKLFNIIENSAYNNYAPVNIQNESTIEYCFKEYKEYINDNSFDIREKFSINKKIKNVCS